MRLPCHALLALATTVVAVFCATPVSAADTTRLTLPSGKEVKAEVMVKPEDRAMGLMFRPSLPQDRVLLFVFDEAEFHGIWMKNCRFPIDIVWLDESKKVVHLQESAPPCKADPCAVFQPMRKASFVVEMNAGQARREGALVGAQVSFDLTR
jgi:uncharacterized membrane protein (UPF0127 family)